MEELGTDSSEDNQVLLISLGYEEVREIGRGSFGQIFSIKAPNGLRAIKTVDYF